MIFGKIVNLKDIEGLFSEEKIQKYAEAIRSQPFITPYEPGLTDIDLVKAHISLIIKSDYKNRVESHLVRENNKELEETL